MNSALTQQNKINFDTETITLIKKSVTPPETTDTEFAMFLYQAQRTGLDPLARQIYAIKSKGKFMIQASIDGLRLIAQRHKDYAGQDEPIWEGEPMSPGFFAKITVYKFAPNGQRYPAAVGVAYFAEYAQRQTDYKTGTQEFSYMWKKMPRVMIAKVAEALALRKAFPQELSGIYSTEEMDQATNKVVNISAEQFNTGTTEPIEDVTPVEELKDTEPWLNSNQVYENPGQLKKEKEQAQIAEVIDDDEKMIRAAEEVFEIKKECNCGTKGKFHKKDCPMHEETPV